MDFEAGQEVTISRNLGKVKVGDKLAYYHGGSIRDIPLGTKGTIAQIGSERIRVGLRDRNGRYWERFFHPGEIKSTTTEEEQKKFNALLEDALAEELPEIEVDQTGDKKRFEPKLNTREEFAMWVRQEFPDLKDYARNGKEYTALLKRKKEVMEGAQKACTHARTTAIECMPSYFIDRFKALESSFKDLKGLGSFVRSGGTFAISLEDFVSFIEHVSRNLEERKK